MAFTEQAKLRVKSTINCMGKTALIALVLLKTKANTDILGIKYYVCAC